MRLLTYPKLAHITFFIFLNLLQSTDFQIIISDKEVELNIDLSSEGFARYRVDCSVDLDEWEIVSSLGLIDG